MEPGRLLLTGVRGGPPVALQHQPPGSVLILIQCCNVDMKRERQAAGLDVLSQMLLGQQQPMKVHVHGPHERSGRPCILVVIWLHGGCSVGAAARLSWFKAAVQCWGCRLCVRLRCCSKRCTLPLHAAVLLPGRGCTAHQLESACWPRRLRGCKRAVRAAADTRHRQVAPT